MFSHWSQFQFFPLVLHEPDVIILIFAVKLHTVLVHKLLSQYLEKACKWVEFLQTSTNILEPDITLTPFNLFYSEVDLILI